MFFSLETTLDLYFSQFWHIDAAFAFVDILQSDKAQREKTHTRKYTILDKEL